MVRKLFITPYFGQQPEWMDNYWLNAERLLEQGYEWLVETDEDRFKERVEDTLGIRCPSMTGTGNIWDFRPAFGVLYADEIKGFDFWGHTDFDCVYGRVQEWVTDEFLARLDIHSNHVNYICGPWTLYRNTPLINTLYQCSSEWQEIMESSRSSGWAETGFTEIVDVHHESGQLVREYTFWQPRNQNDFSSCHWNEDRLMDDNNEIFMLHFRRTKIYPEQLK